MRLDLSRAEEDHVLEGLIIFLAERAEGARICVSPGDMSSKVASTCTYQVNAATYKTRKASEGIWRAAGTVKI